MELSIDLATKIMEAMEKTDKSVIEEDEELLEGIDPEDERLHFHCLMLNQAGLIAIWPPGRVESRFFNSYTAAGQPIMEKEGEPGQNRVIAYPMMLTYEGHKFLETIRNEEAKTRIRDFLTEHGLPFAFSTVKELGFKFLTG